MALGRANEKVRWINEWESIDKKTPNRLTLAVCVFALCQCGNEDDGDGDDNSTDNYVAKRSFNEVVQCINRRRRRQPHRNNNTFKGRSRHSAKLKFKIVFDSTHTYTVDTQAFLISKRRATRENELRNIVFHFEIQFEIIHRCVRVLQLQIHQSWLKLIRCWHQLTESKLEAGRWPTSIISSNFLRVNIFSESD